MPVTTYCMNADPTETCESVSAMEKRILARSRCRLGISALAAVTRDISRSITSLMRTGSWIATPITRRNVPDRSPTTATNSISAKPTISEPSTVVAASALR